MVRRLKQHQRSALAQMEARHRQEIGVRDARVAELGATLEAARQQRARAERALRELQQQTAGERRDRQQLALQRRTLGALSHGLQQGMAGLADELSLAVAIHRPHGATLDGESNP